MPVFNIMTMEERIAMKMESRRIELVVIGSLSLLAFFLAVTEVYGVTNYAVTRKTREFGVKLALGAKLSRIASEVMRRGLLLAVSGLLPGLVLSYACARLFVKLALQGDTRRFTNLPGRRVHTTYGDHDCQSCSGGARIAYRPDTRSPVGMTQRAVAMYSLSLTRDCETALTVKATDLPVLSSPVGVLNLARMWVSPLTHIGKTTALLA